jgi:hypothetical protein
VSNNPVRYTDPTGHRETEGCGDEGKSHCHASDLEVATNSQKLAKLEARVHEGKCASGNDAYCSTALTHPIATTAFVAGGLFLSAAGMAAVGVTTVTAETAFATTTAVEVTNAGCGGDMCSGEVDELSRLFYSGRGAAEEAESWALTHNAVTLSQTETGAELNQVFEASGYNVMRPLAEAASADWAAGASGEVDVFIKTPLLPNSIWATIEYPALLANPSVTTIRIH